MVKREAQRLLRVVKALRESPVPQAFTMDAFVLEGYVVIDHLIDEGIATMNDQGEVFDKKTGKELKDENFCGTPACALGHYGARGDLQRLMKVGRDRIGDSELFYHNNRFVTYDDKAIQDHFGITRDQANELFGPDGCGGAQTPIQAVKYIEKFVRKHYGEVSL